MPTRWKRRQDGHLVGGLYGVAIGGVFFGESMFSVARDASKVALVHLVARLRLGGFRLLDTQFVTAHLAQFGAEELPRDDYKVRLAHAITVPARFLADPDPRIWRPKSTAWRIADRCGRAVGMPSPSLCLSWAPPRWPTSRCCARAAMST